MSSASYHTAVEPLESRRLLSGVTMLIHGYDSSIAGWVTSAANAISQRVDGSSSIYVMSVGLNSKNKLTVTAFTLASGDPIESSTTGEAIIELDWSAVDDGRFTTAAVGDAVATYIMSRHGPARALAELPMHIIGHSRGASMAVAISKDLGQRGLWIDQETFLDPHPVDGVNDMLGATFGDMPMAVYDNVLFADDYWRTDGDVNNLDPDGEPVEGAHNFDLGQTVQQNYVGSAHVAVTSYYHGTIDPTATFNNENPITDDWYGATPDKPSKTQTGFAFTRIGAGKRPLDGMIADLGGTATRIPAGQDGTQWGNLTSTRLLDGSTVTIGPRATLRFVREDRDSEDTITVFLDQDTNPYNGNNVRTLRRFTLDATPTGSEASRIAIPTDDIEPGKYYVGTTIADEDGHLRFAYTGQVEFTPATGASKGGKGSTKATSYFSEAPIPPVAAVAPVTAVKRMVDLVL